MNDFKKDLLTEFAHLRNRNAFNVLRQLSIDEVFEWGNTYIPTRHLVDRLQRITHYETLDLTNSDFLFGFEVDKKHKNGPEIHVINRTGLIYIFNKDTKRFITVLGARPGQISRYFHALKLEITDEVQEVIDKAYENYKKGVNNK